MKNIILIDICSYALESIMAIPDVHISVLVVDSKKQGMLALKKYPDRISNIYYRITSTYEEFLALHKNDYNVTYEEIEKYRNAQLKTEQYLSREVLDYNEWQYRYHIGLSYWLNIFEKNNIDCVISMHLEHGGLYDSIPFEIAKQRNILAFNQNIEFNNGNTTCLNFRCVNNGKLLNLQEITSRYTPPSAESYLHNKNSTSKPVKAKKKNNTLGLFKEKVRSCFKPLKKEFFCKTNIYNYWYNLTNQEIHKNSNYLKRLKKIYNQISVAPKNNEKYIFYGLHMEPEAVIMNRGTMNSQLYIIKMLSESLPDGWKLYVKEHPQQFNSSGIFFYFLRNIFLYRTEQFYRNILDNKNVELINLETSSQTLIENSQGCATICGTIIFESISHHKPVLIFGNDTTVLSEVKDTLKIKSKEDIKDAFNKIKDGFKPQYTDVNEVVQKYLFEDKNQETCVNSTPKDFLIDIFSYIFNLKEY